LWREERYGYVRTDGAALRRREATAAQAVAREERRWPGGREVKREPRGAQGAAINSLLLPRNCQGSYGAARMRAGSELALGYTTYPE